jgi:hypothetical protein
MRRICLKLKTLIITTLFFLLFCGPSLALDFGRNITIYDNEKSGNAGTWYNQGIAPGEDQEVEPGNVTGQQWDLEGFFLDGTDLTIVAGFNLKNGVDDWTSGDIFIDIDGDAEYGIDLSNSASNGVTSVANSFGYDYVVDVDWAGAEITYDLLSIDENAKVMTTYYGSNQRANPWVYASDKIQKIGSTKTMGTDDYKANLSDLQAGFSGGTHYAAIFDLSELFGLQGVSEDNFLAHFTMECGNDNLIGAVPEPSTMIISGIFLIGAGFFVRRKLHAQG